MCSKVLQARSYRLAMLKAALASYNLRRSPGDQRHMCDPVNSNSISRQGPTSTTRSSNRCCNALSEICVSNKAGLKRHTKFIQLPNTVLFHLLVFLDKHYILYSTSISQYLTKVPPVPHEAVNDVIMLFEEKKKLRE